MKHVEGVPCVIKTGVVRLGLIDLAARPKKGDSLPSPLNFSGEMVFLLECRSAPAHMLVKAITRAWREVAQQPAIRCSGVVVSGGAVPWVRH